MDISRHLIEVSESRLKRTLYVGGLDEDEIDKQALFHAFSPFGEIRTLEIPMNRNTGKHRGFGFIEFEEEHDAKAAIKNMNGAELAGRSITVNLARQMKKQAPEEDMPGWVTKFLERQT